MRRKRITELFPGLLPLRKRQRVACFYAGMALDRNRYAAAREKEELPWVQHSNFSPLYNTKTGYDMTYQENKVFNLNLASREMDGLLIRPGETFSFWKAIRRADREIPYKEGLTVVNGKMTATRGGGLCQLSNLLFELFCYSPLEIWERKGHKKKEFPDSGTDLAGLDATVSEGWADLKVRNSTQQVFQIKLALTGERIYGILRTDQRPAMYYKVRNENLVYRRAGGKVYETVAVWRDWMRQETRSCEKKELLYENCCEIGYELPECMEIKEERDEKEDNRNSVWGKLFGV